MKFKELNKMFVQNVRKNIPTDYNGTYKITLSQEEIDELYSDVLGTCEVITEQQIPDLNVVAVMSGFTIFRSE